VTFVRSQNQCWVLAGSPWVDRWHQRSPPGSASCPPHREEVLRRAWTVRPRVFRCSSPRPRRAEQHGIVARCGREICCEIGVDFGLGEESLARRLDSVGGARICRDKCCELIDGVGRSGRHDSFQVCLGAGHADQRTRHVWHHHGESEAAGGVAHDCVEHLVITSMHVPVVWKGDLDHGRPMETTAGTSTEVVSWILANLTEPFTGSRKSRPAAVRAL